MPLTNGDWREHAACNTPDVDADDFFPADGSRVKKSVRELCAGCPVRNHCLEDALAYDPQDDWGFWGGTTAPERRAIRAARRRGQLTRPADDPPNAFLRRRALRVALAS